MGNLIQELKRGNVFRVAVVYAIVECLLIQIADSALPALPKTEWAIAFVTVLFLLVIPIAVILAWTYELIPQLGLFKKSWNCFGSIHIV